MWVRLVNTPNQLLLSGLNKQRHFLQETNEKADILREVLGLMMKKHKKHNSILCWQDAHIKFELVLTKMVEIGTFMFTYSLDLLGLDI